jgi:N-dimethylarginine dimethylaminohydrolase
MFPPDYYDIIYEINPWMSVKRKANRELAQKQWEDFYQLLTEKLGVRVEILKPVVNLPDLVFTANGGLVSKRNFIRANFRHKERQPEARFFEDWFRRKGWIVKLVPPVHYFEGEGDALFFGKDLYTGYHFRSDLEAQEFVAGALHVSYYALELVDKRFYHLDTCFAPLDEKTALVYLPAFEPYSQQILRETIPDLVEVPEEEALRFACNDVVVDQNVILNVNCPKTEELLRSRGFTPHALDFSEFIKAGGSAKCLALWLSPRSEVSDTS